MKINPNTTIKSMQDALGRLEKKAGSKGEVDVSDIRNASLRELASTVQTGCTSSVSVARLKTALKTVGADIKRADVDKDGQLDTREQAKLSPLAARLLQVTKDRPSGGGTVSSGCTAGGGAPVSTGCATGSGGHVSTGGGGRTVTVRTGC